MELCDCTPKSLGCQVMSCGVEVVLFGVWLVFVLSVMMVMHLRV